MFGRVMGRWSGFVLLLALPVIVLLVLRLGGAPDIALRSGEFHLIVVGAIAACALVVAVLAVGAATRSSHSGPVFLGIGCSAVGVLLLAHGLTTPGVIGQPFNQWVGRLPYMAMLVFALMLVVAGGRSDGALHRLAAGHPASLSWLSLGAFVALAAVVVIDPHQLAGAQPLPSEETIRDVAAVVVVLLSLRSVWVHWHRWHLGHDVLQFALVVASAMNIAAITAIEHGEFPRLSWYDYHAYLLAGFGSAVYAIFGRFRRTRTIEGVLQSTFDDDPFAHIQQGYPEALRTLVRAVELKDRYTHGHSQRTAKLATELGLQLGLAPDQLRVIARGAYLHDIGKIGIPDTILNKPSGLTDDERAVIETHPQLGYEMASSAPSLTEALSIILHHHEKYDGTGYPKGLKGAEIPLTARVVAVADVWDALTTDRAYRPGWEPSQALAHIDAGRGTHFDGAVVDALIDLAAGWGVRLGAEPGEADQAWAAAQSCHEVDDGELVGV